jgi:hypothetical protein
MSFDTTQITTPPGLIRVNRWIHNAQAPMCRILHQRSCLYASESKIEQISLHKAQWIQRKADFTLLVAQRNQCEINKINETCLSSVHLTLILCLPFSPAQRSKPPSQPLNSLRFASPSPNAQLNSFP